MFTSGINATNSSQSKHLCRINAVVTSGRNNAYEVRVLNCGFDSSNAEKRRHYMERHLFISCAVNSDTLLNTTVQSQHKQNSGEKWVFLLIFFFYFQRMLYFKIMKWNPKQKKRHQKHLHRQLIVEHQRFVKCQW